MSPKHPKSAKSTESPTFEVALAQIEAIIEKIESGEVGLEESLAEYERGVALVNLCRASLEKASAHIEDLTARLNSADNQDGSGGDDSSSDDEDPDDAPEPEA